VKDNISIEGGEGVGPCPAGGGRGVDIEEEGSIKKGPFPYT